MIFPLESFIPWAPYLWYFFIKYSPCPLSSWNLGFAQMTFYEIRSAKASQKCGQKDPEDDHRADNDHPDRGRQLHVRAPEDFIL